MAGIRKQDLWGRFFIIYPLYDDEGDSDYQYVRVHTVVRQGGLNIICRDISEIAERTKQVKEAMTSLKTSTIIYPKTYPPPPKDETFTVEF